MFNNPIEILWKRKDLFEERTELTDTIHTADEFDANEYGAIWNLIVNACKSAKRFERYSAVVGRTVSYFALLINESFAAIAAKESFPVQFRTLVYNKLSISVQSIYRNFSLFRYTKISFRHISFCRMLPFRSCSSFANICHSAWFLHSFLLASAYAHVINTLFIRHDIPI